MKVKEILEKLENYAPASLAESWDNVGLLVGDENREVKKVYIAMDATEEVIHQAIACDADLLVTHHPLIFQGVKKIQQSDFIGKRIVSLIENHISYIAMHTNYDIARMGEMVGEKLQLQNMEPLTEEGLGRVGDLQEPMSHEAFADYIKETLELSYVKVFKGYDSLIRKVALLPGSGKSEIDTALAKGADAYITGDVDHHSGIDAAARGLTIFDGSHYGTEYLFVGDMEKYLKKFDLLINIEEKKMPFEMY